MRCLHTSRILHDAAEQRTNKRKQIRPTLVDSVDSNGQSKKKKMPIEFLPALHRNIFFMCLHNAQIEPHARSQTSTLREHVFHKYTSVPVILSARLPEWQRRLQTNTGPRGTQTQTHFVRIYHPNITFYTIRCAATFSSPVSLLRAHGIAHTRPRPRTSTYTCRQTT